MTLRLNVVSTSNQQFNFTAGGDDIQVNLQYNTVATAWFVTLTADGVEIYSSRKLVTGVDLAPEYIEGTLYAKDSSNNELEPDFNRLVSGDTRLYYFTKEEIDSAVANGLAALEELSNQQATLQDGGPIGVPIEQFNTLAATVATVQQKCEDVEGELDALELTVAAQNDAVIQQIQSLLTVVGDIQNTAATTAAQIQVLRIREVGFSLDEPDPLVEAARWTSTKAYIIRAQAASKTGANRATADTSASTATPSVYTIRRGTDFVGTVSYTNADGIGEIEIPNDRAVNPGDFLTVSPPGTNEGEINVSITVQLEEQL